MKQVLQSLADGTTEVAEVPCPQVRPGCCLIQTHSSLISAGTERMLLDFGRSSWVTRARQQPDKVRQVIDKVKTDGVLPTLEAVRNKLDEPIPMGYCNVGTVVEVGSGVTEFEVGDRVVSNGSHAEFVIVPKNLCAKIPDNVSDQSAAFTVIGAIALQGIRLAKPTLGESFAVVGLGLVGLMTVQLLKAHGCRVIGLDFSPQRLELARQAGAETVDLSKDNSPIETARKFSKDRGLDGVLIAASTDSNEPIRQAALMSRKRGRIVLLGVAGMQISRADFYEKELTFQVSCSYGPGRYDHNYEQKGNDYPVPFVRWTEQRNFEAVLDMVADQKIDVSPLISHQFELEQAKNAYEIIGGKEPSLGVLLNYSKPEAAKPRQTAIRFLHPKTHFETDVRRPKIGFIGAGNFTRRVLLPAFQKTGAQLETIATIGGVSATHAAKKYGIREATTDATNVINSPNVDIVVIGTRHDTHADFVVDALQAGKQVFVEKPLALNSHQLSQIKDAYETRLATTDKPPQLMVGFNRRFAPHIQLIAERLAADTTPKSFIMTVNAGHIPEGHWTQDPNIGGGRIIGEACHHIDLLRFLSGHSIVGVQAMQLHGSRFDGDKMTLSLQFADGSFGTVHYMANGHRSFPKERLEVFSDGQIYQMDNYRKLRCFGDAPFSKKGLWKQDRGYQFEVDAFVDAVQHNTECPIPTEQAFEVTQVSFDIVELAQVGGSKTYDLQPATNSNTPEPNESTTTQNEAA